MSGLVRMLLLGLVRLLVGASARWIGCGPETRQRIYFANHSSHMDTLALWAAMPVELRRRTRPVAALDYWGKGRIRRFIALQCLNCVLIDRQRGEGNPLASLNEALEQGDSLIVFPEGTRSKERLPQPFKGGLHLLAKKFPQVELVPVYLDTLHRSMPKGRFLPVPLICTVRFGTPVVLGPDEDKDAFLERARAAVVEVA